MQHRAEDRQIQDWRHAKAVPVGVNKIREYEPCCLQLTKYGYLTLLICYEVTALAQLIDICINFYSTHMSNITIIYSFKE